MTLSPAILAPAITYGNVAVYSNTNNATTGGVPGGVYRIEQWPTATSNTYPIGWDMDTGSSTSMTMNVIQFRTLDTPYTQYAQGANYTIRYYNGVADTAAHWTYGTSGVAAYPQKTPAERLREILNNRMAPGVLSSCKPLGYTNDVREVRARETLCRVLGEDRFRNFVRRGSVSVRAKSGMVYQIFPGSDFTNVYDSGKLVERLCVVLLGGFPPTDSLIMRYLLILNNEAFFRSKAIKHGISGYGTSPTNPDNRSLVEIYREIKGNAA